MTFGLLTTGFSKKALTDLLAEIEASEKDLISPYLDLTSPSLFSIINGIFADKLRELWDVAEEVYRSQYPDSANGDALDQLAALTGAYRLAARKSTVTLDQLFLDNGATIPAGSLVSVGLTGNQFKTLVAVTNSYGYPATFSVDAEASEYGELSGWANTIDTIVSPQVGWNAKATLTCANSETYALNGKTFTLKVDRGSEQSMTFTGADPWTAAAAASAINTQTSGLTAQDAGGKVRIASDTDGPGSALEITGGTALAVFGFATDEIKGFNTIDAELGRLSESDAAFRIRRIQLLRLTGAGTVEAIKAAILDVDGVTDVFVFENTSTLPYGGIPGKAFESVVKGGLAPDIAGAIWNVKPAGIEAYGSTSQAVLDSNGDSHTIGFSRPDEIPIYIDLSITVDWGLFPLDGIDQVKAALVTKGDALEIGEDIYTLQFKSTPLEIPGVLDVTVFKIDDVTPPTNTANMTFDFREEATFDTSRINVTVI